MSCIAEDEEVVEMKADAVEISILVLNSVRNRVMEIAAMKADRGSSVPTLPTTPP